MWGVFELIEYKKLVRSKALIPIDNKPKGDLLNESKVSKDKDTYSERKYKHFF